MVCSDGLKGEPLKALACSLKKRLICKYFAGVSYRIYFEMYENRLVTLRSKYISSWNMLNPANFLFYICAFFAFLCENFPANFYLHRVVLSEKFRQIKLLISIDGTLKKFLQARIIPKNDSYMQIVHINLAKMFRTPVSGGETLKS